MKNIYKTLKQARKSQRISQREIGELTNTPQSHISKIESGQTDVHLSKLIEISRALGHEPMLIPHQYLTAVEAIIHGENSQEPAWQPDELDNEVSDE